MPMIINLSKSRKIVVYVIRNISWLFSEIKFNEIELIWNVQMDILSLHFLNTKLWKFVYAGDYEVD